MQKIFKILFLLIFLSFSTYNYAKSAATSLTITDGYVREMIPGQKMTAAYFTINNKDRKNYTLKKVKSSIAERIEIHETVLKDNIMRMQPVSQLEIKRKARVELVPGGLHVMVMGVDKPLVSGEMLPLVLIFDDGSEISLNLAVKSLN